MTINKQNLPTTHITEIVLPGLVEPTGLQINQRPLPAPAKGEALIQMEATGVSFAEQQMRRGKYPAQPAFPFVPGYDLVGTVRAVGPEVSESLIGTRVAAVIKVGGWATHVVLPRREHHLRAAPDRHLPDRAVRVVVRLRSLIGPIHVRRIHRETRAEVR